MNPLKTIHYHIYLLQLENYNLRRYGKILWQRYMPPPGPFRKPIVWTAKLKIITALSIGTHAALVYIAWQNSPWNAIAGCVAGFYLYPIFLAFGACAVSPLDAFLKWRIINAARQKIASLPNLKIIAIAGSYGKTTMKELLATILAEQFTILKTPDSVNTPVGIARLILEHLKPHTDIFIVEMGAYQRGDIAALCALTHPHIAVLTGINESHLERFGSMQNAIAAKFEIIGRARPDAILIFNKDNELIMNNYERHTGKRTAYFFSSRDDEQTPPPKILMGGQAYCRITRSALTDNGLGLALTMRSPNATYDFKMPLLGNYAIGVATAVIAMGEIVGMSTDAILRGMTMIKPIAHRLQPILMPNNILVIDDSYNGNPDGAREAIGVLARFTNRRKIYVTPGLVEMGTQNIAVHRTLGKQLARVVNMVLLIKNSATVFIAEGLARAGFDEKNILWFTSMPDVQKKLPDILKSKDVVLFQNDWPENYL